MATLPFEQPETATCHLQTPQLEIKSLPVGSPPLYHRMFQSKRTVETYSFNQAYVDRLAEGHTETAVHFYAYFTKLLLMKFRARMSSASQAEDVAQETLYRVLKYLKEKGGIDYPDRLGAFVIKVSEHVLQEFFRQGNRFLQVPENTPEPVERALNAEVNCITNETKEMLRSVLRKLKTKEQVLLEKVFLLEEDKDSICSELKISRNYLRVKVCRALEHCREVLKQSSTGVKSASAN